MSVPGSSVGKVIRAYLFALDPTPAQGRAFGSHCGAQRVAYNWCLAWVRANWAQRAAEQSYGLVGDELTPWINTLCLGAARRLERGQGGGGAVGGRQQQGGLRVGVRQLGDRAAQLQGRAGPDASGQVQAPHPPDLPLHHRPSGWARTAAMFGCR